MLFLNTQQMSERDQCMVFGWTHCSFINVTDILRTKGAKVFTSSLGACGNEHYTLENRKIDQIPSSPTIKGICKAALTNLMLENYKRRRIGLSLIPLIFCIETLNNPYPTTPKSITQRNGLITPSELRRLYKICHEVDPELNQVAKATVQFVKVILNITQNEAILERHPPFWEMEGWEEAWSERLSTKKVGKEAPIFSWREQLKERMKDYDTERAPSSHCANTLEEELTSFFEDKHNILACDLNASLFTAYAMKIKTSLIIKPCIESVYFKRQLFLKNTEPFKDVILSHSNDNNKLELLLQLNAHMRIKGWSKANKKWISNQNLEAQKITNKNFESY